MIFDPNFLHHCTLLGKKRGAVLCYCDVENEILLFLAHESTIHNHSWELKQRKSFAICLLKFKAKFVGLPTKGHVMQGFLSPLLSFQNILNTFLILCFMNSEFELTNEQANYK